MTKPLPPRSKSRPKTSTKPRQLTKIARLQARITQLEWQAADLQEALAAVERQRLGFPPEGSPFTRALAELNQALLQVAEALQLVPAQRAEAVAPTMPTQAEVAELLLTSRLAVRNRSSKRAARGRVAR